MSTKIHEKSPLQMQREGLTIQQMLEHQRTCANLRKLRDRPWWCKLFSIFKHGRS